MLKVVLDTSVFISAGLKETSTGAASQVVKAWKSGHFTLVMAPQLLEELAMVLLRRGASEESVYDLVSRIASIALYIPGSFAATRLDAIDPNDNMFLAAAFEARADYLVSLDRHLLFLKHYHGTQVRTPALFLRALRPS